MDITGNTTLTKMAFMNGKPFAAYGQPFDIAFVPKKNAVRFSNGVRALVIDVEEIDENYFVISDCVGNFKAGQKIYFSFCELK